MLPNTLADVAESSFGVRVSLLHLGTVSADWTSFARPTPALARGPKQTSKRVGDQLLSK